LGDDTPQAPDPVSTLACVGGEAADELMPCDQVLATGLFDRPVERGRADEARQIEERPSWVRDWHAPAELHPAPVEVRALVHQHTLRTVEPTSRDAQLDTGRAESDAQQTSRAQV
jgi:hypothetical protein